MSAKLNLYCSPKTLQIITTVPQPLSQPLGYEKQVYLDAFWNCYLSNSLIS